MEEQEEAYELTQEGRTYYRGTQEGCAHKLQRIQGHSYSWATKYDGWKVSPIVGLSDQEKEEILSLCAFRKVQAVLLENGSPGNNKKCLVMYKGRKSLANGIAMTYPNGSKQGDVINVLQGYVVTIDHLEVHKD